jgi:tetratricopeptide (TPR) repeat protein
MKQSTEKYFEVRMPSWYLQAGFAAHAFIGGLISYRVYRETRDFLWTERGREFKARIQTWKDQGSTWNFEHKLYLIEAEESYSNGDFERAKLLYENAIKSAKQHKFIHEEALAYELGANFYLAMNNKSMAMSFFTKAHEKYTQWQAFAKVKALSELFQETFGAQPGATLGNYDKIMETLPKTNIAC